MTAHLTPSRLRKVPVPPDVRKAVASILETDRPNDTRPGIQKAAALLGVGADTMHELTAVRGFVKPTTIAKVRARLAELGIAVAS